MSGRPRSELVDQRVVPNVTVWTSGVRMVYAVWGVDADEGVHVVSAERQARPHLKNDHRGLRRGMGAGNGSFSPPR